jgi:CHAT domain-containing protein/Tfp pilus assembly protein PilF
MRFLPLCFVFSTIILLTGLTPAQAEFYKFEGKLTVEAYSGLGCEKQGVKAGRQFDVVISLESSAPISSNAGSTQLNGYLISPSLYSGRFKGALGASLPFEFATPTLAQASGHSVTVQMTANKTTFAFKEKAPDPALEECQWELATFEGFPTQQGSAAEKSYELAQTEFEQDLAHVLAARKDPVALKKLADLIVASRKLIAEKKHADAVQVLNEAQTIIEQLYPNSWMSQKNLSDLADQFEDLGDVAKAIAVQNQAFVLSGRLFKSNDNRIEAAAITLARLLEANGRNKEAVPLRLKALQIIEKNEGKNSTRLGTQLNNLAMVYERLNELTQAQSAYLGALEIFENHNGKTHSSIGAVLNNLGGLYIKRAMYSDALPTLTRALKIAQENRGVGHVETAASLNNLALIHERMGAFQLALPFYQQALMIHEVAYGAEHPLTGTSLNNLALVLEALGRFSEALPIVQRALLIAEKSEGPNSVNRGNRLNSLAGIYRNMGQYAQALPMYEQALQILDNTNEQDQSGVATTLSNLSVTLRNLTQFARALPLAQRALEITEKTHGSQHPLTGNRQNNLASLYESTGQFAKAFEWYQRSLKISELIEGPDHFNTGIRLNNLGALHNATGNYLLALSTLKRALAISEKSEGSEHPNTGIRARNLAGVYSSLGQYGLAQQMYQRALSIAEKSLGSEHPDVAGLLVNIAILLGNMGQYEQAQPLLERALLIADKSLGSDNEITGRALNSLGVLLSNIGQPYKALNTYQRALLISERIFGPDHPTVSVNLNNIAEIYRTTNRVSEALPIYERALKIAEQAEGVDHPSTASRLNNLALAYESLGLSNQGGGISNEIQHSNALYLRAYAITVRAGDVALSKTIQGNLARLYRSQKQNELAILFGKEAVNSIQTLRANSAGTGSSAQQSLLALNKSTYEDLAKWLIEAGRVSEAQQVIAMLKEDELQGFTLSSGAQDPRRSIVEFIGPEVQWHQKTRTAAVELNGLAQRYEELKKILPDVRSAAQNTEIIQTEKALLQSQKQFVRTLATIQQEAGSLVGKVSSDVRSLADRSQNNVRDLVGSLSAQGQISTAALQYLVTDNKVYIIFTTATTQVARESTVEINALRKQLTEFRKVLQSPSLDPKPMAQALHKLLIAPVLADIKAANAQHLMISSTDSLRYVPFAALHDGESYLMQRYQLSTMTEAAAARGMKTPVPAWSISALGVSERVSEEFTALPAVGNELRALVRTDENPSGALPGQIFLNASFTSEQYRTVIQKRPPVIHLATHFKFAPGTEAKSFLLLGNGKPLSLADMMSEQYRFTNLDLLTLSACETALGGGVGENGREVEGLGAQAQRAGAAAVIATLWQVADESTFQLMQRFYALRTADTKINKSEAMRQAQISLIEGKIRPSTVEGTEQSVTRGASRTSTSGDTTSFRFDSSKPYAHPFYWAPFVLMGNWL